MPTTLAPRTPPPRKAGKALTGRTVALSFVAFFAAVIVVNAVMVRAALSTFGGVQTQSSYRAGLAFSREIERAFSQDARHWAVDATLTPPREGRSELRVTARDAGGRPLTGLTLDARLAHPIDERRDHRVTLSEIGPGIYLGATEAVPGAWDLLLDLKRNDERLFRSKSRITLR